MKLRRIYSGALNLVAAGLLVSTLGMRTGLAVCGDGTLDSNEQCDDGGTLPDGGCDATCKLDASGIKCKRALLLQMRKLGSSDMTLTHKCLDRVANGKIACQASQCVLNPATTATIVPGSSCTTATDCCPAFDSKTATMTTTAKLDKVAAATAKAMRKGCSLDVGVDGMKGTDDDTYVDPQTLGISSTCIPAFACSGISADQLSSPGPNNDFPECVSCLTSGLAQSILVVHYPLAADNAAEVTCQRQVGVQARKESVNLLALLQKCFDRIANNKLACVGGVCTINPLSMNPIAVPSSTCSNDNDCCPNMDNADPTKTTTAKMASASSKIATGIKKGCSLDVGADTKKGTDDDTFVDPQELGYGSTCPDVFGSCSSVATTDLNVSGSDNDLIDCVACTQSFFDAFVVHMVIP